MTKISAFLHGEKPSSADIIMTYYISILFGIYAVFNAFLTESNLNFWQITLIGIVALDLAGGVISSLTKSTKEFYAKSPKLEYLFLVLHFIHPLVLALALGLHQSFFYYSFLFMLCASLFVIAMRRTRYELSIALLLVTIGTSLAFQFLSIPQSLIWFIPLYFAKLIVAFSSKYPLE